MATPLTNIGSRPAAYGPTEWGLTFTIALIWGSAFLWIALGVLFRSETVSPLALAGVVLVIVGAFYASRSVISGQH